jgi:hypothetical protein
MPKVPQVTNPESAGVPMLDLNGGGGGASLPLYTQVEPSADYWFLYPPVLDYSLSRFEGPALSAGVAYVPAGRKLHLAIHTQSGGVGFILGVYNNVNNYPGSRLWSSGPQTTVENSVHGFNTNLSFSVATAVWLAVYFGAHCFVVSGWFYIINRFYVTSGVSLPSPEACVGPIDGALSELPETFPSGGTFDSDFIYPLIFQRWV